MSRGATAQPGWRTGALAVGALVVLAGLAPVWGDGFTAHVVSHLLIGMLGPLLVVLGDPLGQLLGRAQPRVRRTLLRALHHPISATLSRPVIAWLLAVLSPWLLWLTPLYRITERNDVLHALVHLHFLGAGLLFATVVLGVGPLGRKVPPAGGLLLLALTLPTHALLGLIVLSMNEPVLGVAAGGVDALADQRRGAVVMWLAGDLIATAMLGAAFPRWLQAERRRSRREDEWVARSTAGEPASAELG
jgi:putative membrane protein